MRYFKRIALWAVLSVVALVGLFVLQSWRLASSKEPLFVIEHDVEIEAPTAEVWQVLTDFASYPEWNPYAIRLAGVAALGETIELTIAQENWPEPLVVTPTIVRLDAGREIGWHGRAFFTGLHETAHYFQLVPLGPNRTRLHQAEEFRGWLPARVEGSAEWAYTENAFRAMNEALKRRVEGVDQSSVEPPRTGLD